MEKYLLAGTSLLPEDLFVKVLRLLGSNAKKDIYIYDGARKNYR